ncbi:MAG TPA: NADH-quinone oxidoreductase subunit L [candidate division Zixibacteria bacterium]|nr:NADH-quinone oxidoreductase subunit L [candidate division Zixibacteria bacterium]
MVAPHPTPAELDLLRWIPFLPLLGTVLNLALGARLGRRAAGWLATLAVAASFGLSLYVFLELSATAAFRDRVYTWIQSGSFRADLSLQVDALAAVMLLVVTGIGALIHLYSIGYMGHDEDAVRFFAYLNLFVFFMLLLVMADNLLLLFVGWEGVGLCSYLLIGFWYRDPANATAANKAFIVNRIGDFGFILGILLAVTELGRGGVWTLDFAQMQANVGLLAPAKLTLITLLLFAGATGKSAQIPLFVWLPDAMAGPTPVSALIHAATMVTAGVYMIARLHFLFALAPLTLSLIALVGGATAFFAATIALAQNDIKRVLAYSTVSQLGYMFLAAGAGAFSAAIFHLFTHAFFKACLFLGSGSVIHALGGEQDMRKMGGLKPHLPRTYWTYLVATLAIAGAPLTAGFFSKDMILWQLFQRGWHGLWLLGLITAGLTAFYMFRQLFMVFHGACRAEPEVRARLHESPAVMTVPLIVLALGSIFSGWLGAPDYLWGSRWDAWLRPVFGGHPAGEHGDLGAEILTTLLTLSVVAAAIYLAYLCYGRAAAAADPLSTLGAPYRLLAGKYYVDEIYDLLFVRPFTAISRWLAEVCDPGLVDGAVNGIAAVARGLSEAWRELQTGNVQHYLLGFLAGTLVLLAYYLGRI